MLQPHLWFLVAIRKASSYNLLRRQLQNHFGRFKSGSSRRQLPKVKLTMEHLPARIRFCVTALSLIFALNGSGLAAARKASSKSSSKSSSRSKSSSKSHRGSRGRFTPAVDPTIGDNPRFDDQVVRQVAISALGKYNGSVLAMDPKTGRILTIVNQKMAFSSGFEPCSTIKPTIAIAGLEQGVITRDTMLQVGRRRYMDLTEAMAHSNNKFFEEVGRKLGFDNVHHYAEMLGFGQRAGYNIEEEQPGLLPTAPPRDGVGRMSSFGQGIKVTPLQLAALVSTVANGGTMYYLQYPRSEEEIQTFSPRVRRQLNLEPLLPELREGMLAAVMYGTAKRSYDPEGEQTLGKTGTCNDESAGGRLGWFASYADQSQPRMVVVVLLRGGGHRVSGPGAADVAGRVYRGLRERNYFADNSREQQAVASTGPGTR
jgi:penicillin-binding protein 2